MKPWKWKKKMKRWREIINDDNLIKQGKESQTKKPQETWHNDELHCLDWVKRNFFLNKVAEI